MNCIGSRLSPRASSSSSHRRSLACGLLARRVRARHRADSAQDLGDAGFLLGLPAAERRTDRHRRRPRGRVWIASFIFTHCPLSCPRITTIMKGLQEKLERQPALLVSLSVDPEHDTPEVLADLRPPYEAEPDRWWFLTGPKSSSTT